MIEKHHPDPHHDPMATDGAVDFSECPTRVCHCERCAVCGEVKHCSLHGPVFGNPPGSKPWGHRFVSRRGAPDGGAAVNRTL
jgi:hypothetical protein